MEKLAHNYHALRQLTPYGTKFMGLVKADAYGHGAVPVAKKLEELGADYLGVACLDEAIELREAGSWDVPLPSMGKNSCSITSPRPATTCPMPKPFLPKPRAREEPLQSISNVTPA